MPTILKPVTATASLTLNKYDHGENVVNISAAAGLTVTLPPSTGSGVEFEVFVATTVTSNSYIIQVTDTDIIQGGVALSTDIGGTNMLTAATTDTITMNGSTTGGLKGSWVKVKDVASGIWRLNGFLVTTGTEATPFSAAVPA